MVFDDQFSKDGNMYPEGYEEQEEVIVLSSPETNTKKQEARLGLPLLFLISLAVMIPWPLVGIGLTYTNFDQPNESGLLFGGVTALAIVPMYLLAEPSESVFAVILIVVWLIAFLAPPIALRLKKCTRNVVIILWILQSGFSFAQASMGMLMIWGKNC